MMLSAAARWKPVPRMPPATFLLPNYDEYLIAYKDRDLLRPQGATIGDLVAALKEIRASSRDVIAILQGIKRAGALHAELIIQ